MSRFATLTRRRAVAVLALSGALAAGAAGATVASAAPDGAAGAAAVDTAVTVDTHRPGGGPERPPVPPPPGPRPLPAGAPTPGAGFRIASVYTVTNGTQTYTCAADLTGTGAWGATSVPEARLARYGLPGRIHHYAGPRWTSERDGSTVLGSVRTKAPQTGTIAWLLVDVIAHENSAPGRELDRVTNISRINTSGGVAPAGACTVGATVAVPYHADYVFWVPSA